MGFRLRPVTEEAKIQEREAGWERKRKEEKRRKEKRRKRRKQGEH